MNAESLAAYVVLATLVCTALDKVVDALRPLAASTKTKADDDALDFVDRALDTISGALSFLSLRSKGPK